MKKIFRMVSVLILSIVTPVFSQLSVVSSYPTHGDINVDTAATFVLNFNEPLDTSARFEYPGDFFLNLYFYPDSLIGEPDSIVLSTDLMTVNVYNLHLEFNTTYLFTLVDAVSTSEDSLAQPYSMTFTTASVLATADVSGSLSYPGHDPEGTWVAILNDYPFKERGGSPVNGIVIPPSSDSYTINYVDTGWYWVGGIKNFHVGEEINPMIEEGTGVGFLDADNDYIVDSIYVSLSSHITGIDFTLHTAILQTAKEPLTLVGNAVRSWATDAFLVRVLSEVNSDGNSTGWEYIFYSPSLAERTSWLNVGDLVVRGVPDEFPSDTVEVPTNWVDSDLILGIAESQGGSDFRQAYPDAEIRSLLGQFSIEYSSPKLNLLNSKRNLNNTFFNYLRFNHIITKNAMSGFNLLDNINGLTSFVWVVQYYSPEYDEYLLFIMDPVSGEILNTSSTATDAEEAAFPIAQDWSSDAKLWNVFNQFGSLDTLGSSEFWSCIYYSPSLDSLHSVTLWGQIPVISGSPGFLPTDTLTIPFGWFDSDYCLLVAEAGGGSNYRYSNLNVIINASLMRWSQGFNPDWTIWTFTYSSSTTPDLQILVNAFEGIVVGVEAGDKTYIPQKFNLSQNYPNPFNPSTKIIYEIPEKDFVTLTIYNLLGSEVAILVNEEKGPGKYEVEFNAGDLASGVYIYRLKSGSNTLSRKLVLLK